jgi:hypothetical protein
VRGGDGMNDEKQKKLESIADKLWKAVSEMNSLANEVHESNIREDIFKGLTFKKHVSRETYIQHYDEYLRRLS